MKNYIQEGDTLTITAPAIVKSGEFVQVGRIRGVAVTDAASGAQVEVRTTGVYELEKLGSEAFATVGLPVYVVAASDGVKKVTVADGTDNVLIGINLSTSAASPGSILVKLMPSASNQFATTVA